MDSSTDITIVPFHGRNLFLVEHDGQPYTPMKTIVEGMGLAWTTQRRKLDSNSARWGVIKMIIPPVDLHNDAVCIPVRKLPGWLMTISPNKIKDASVRERVIQYQNECDDALWAYWSDGIAINPRATLTPAHQRGIQKAVARRCQALPEPARRSAYSRIYSHLKDRFEVGSYKDIDDSRYTEALGAVQSFKLEGEWIEAMPEAAPASFTDDDLSDLYILLCHVDRVCRKWREYDLYQALRCLQSPAAAEMCESVSMAEAFKTRLARNKGDLMEVSRRRLGMNYGILPAA